MSDEKLPDGWLRIGDNVKAPYAFVCKRSGTCISVQRMGDLLATVGLALVPAADVPTPEERAVLGAVCKVVRERMYATTPACMKVMGEYDSRTLRQVEALLFPPAAKEKPHD